MRRSLLLLLGLLVLHHSCSFEFVIDGEWEDEEPGVHDHLQRHKRATLTSEEEEDFQAIRGDDIKVKSYRVESRITSRFAHTTIRSSVVNSNARAQSIGFSVQIPKRAFISNFTMNVNGITFVGSVKEKTVARRLYAQATARNKAAAIIRANSQDLETFNTEVHVPPGSNIEFELHYQEMMERRLGSYEHLLYLQPGRLVPQFQVDVYIYEPKGISKVEAHTSLGERFEELIQLTVTKDKAHAVFKPNLQQQRKCENCTDSAIDGVFSVAYDVTRDSNAGELQVSDLYFVHFFAPENLSPLPKNIVFVIDVSGSMWGVKMKQTVEAMTAILDDLKDEDRFSIIDFNHNVRCWREDLVPAHSLQVADAKRYIQNIKPNGGTNINEALLRAAQMLVRASTQGFVDSSSVSMIILVSDGDPTVGEIKLSKIQKNVKRVMTEEISLFSLGIGFDVDYDFLERIAMENRGTAQRIYANQDAAKQIREFYSQVSSPLLKRVSIKFPEDSVTEVTQSNFDKFFSGSELVVAGKVQLTESDTLTSITSASAAGLDLSLQTDADLTELDLELAKQQHSFTGFARQMWAYLTIKQLIRERSLVTTVGKKRRITKQITELALQHSFVTPLTALLVESEDATERLLFDSSRDPRQGCCAGGQAPSGPVPAVNVVYALPPPWVQGPTPTPASQAKPVVEKMTLPSTVTVVDSDPHFIVHLPRSNMDVCFNIDSKPGHILNLVSDAGTGVVVNGQLISSKQPHKDKLSTYFGIVSVYYQPEGVGVTVSTDRIAVTDGRNNHSFTWGATAEIAQDGVTVSIVKNSHATVTINNSIRVMVLLHRVWRKHPVNVDFLGIYIPNDNRYSPLVHGLIGQFSREPQVNVYDVHEGPDPLKKEATMEVKGQVLLVTRGWQKDYRRDTKRGNSVSCWFVHNSAKGFIDGHYTDYIVPHLSSFLQTA
ncbi:inter-alpha-trypsin inhibitor heavy chain H2 [Fundulus heteroclitus]|uniref:inter-alpha-trypsin inhibitor heavy chain H2 n=1 Tax=Fundulus heteroclitus TaxID=8078 RepID=UPI00165C0D13|nr:inter-alpha-trypsin inhibitor heavy chain H2 [Fundulus heteroclitus]